MKTKLNSMRCKLRIPKVRASLWRYERAVTHKTLQGMYNVAIHYWNQSVLSYCSKLTVVLFYCFILFYYIYVEKLKVIHNTWIVSSPHCNKLVSILASQVVMYTKMSNFPQPRFDKIRRQVLSNPQYFSVWATD